MKVGICKLCLQKKELCRKSHIIPSFHYKFLYGPNKKLIYLNSRKSEVRYNSEYESDILCRRCDEEVLGKLDDYAAKFIHNKFPQKSVFSLERIDGKNCLVLENCPNYNYTRFKLFVLSLLWRASITSRPFFQAVKLDHEVEEELRLMILNNISGDPSKLPCFVCLPPLMSGPDGKLGFDTLHMPTMSPQHLKTDDFEGCEFIIEGMHYYFFISTPKGWKIAPGLEEGKLTIGFASVQDQGKLLQKIIQMMVDQQSN